MRYKEKKYWTLKINETFNHYTYIKFFINFSKKIFFFKIFKKLKKKWKKKRKIFTPDILLKKEFERGTLVFFKNNLIILYLRNFRYQIQILECISGKNIFNLSFKHSFFFFIETSTLMLRFHPFIN